MTEFIVQKNLTKWMKTRSTKRLSVRRKVVNLKKKIRLYMMEMSKELPREITAQETARKEVVEEVFDT